MQDTYLHLNTKTREFRVKNVYARMIKKNPEMVPKAIKFYNFFAKLINHITKYSRL